MAGCASQKGTPIAMTPEDQQTAERTIAGSLGFPDEARFQDFHAFSVPGGILFCGAVRSEKSFGGYAGFVRFFQIWASDGKGYLPQPVVMERTPDGKLASAREIAHSDCK